METGAKYETEIIQNHAKKTKQQVSENTWVSF